MLAALGGHRFIKKEIPFIKKRIIKPVRRQSGMVFRKIRGKIVPIKGNVIDAASKFRR